MGLENRDYIRDHSYSGGYGYAPHRGYWAVKFLIIANVVVFLLQNTVPHLTDWLDLRQAVKVASDAEFYRRDVPAGKAPRSLAVPVAETPGDERIDAGSVVVPVDNATYGNYSLVRWNGQYGLVRTDLIRLAPLHSWQLSWRLLTHGFCHGSLTHILFNMLVLFFIGRMIEPILGSREFLLFFLCGILVAGLGHIGFQLVVQRNIPAVGASGGVMAALCLAAMTFPRQRVYVFGVIPVELRVLAIILVAWDVFWGLLDRGVGGGTAHFAHLGGAAFGVAYKYYGWNISGLWQSVRQWFRFRSLKARPKIRVYRPEEPEDDVDERVDRLLEKISKHGESSLTDAERDFLAEASRRYRKR